MAWYDPSSWGVNQDQNQVRDQSRDQMNLLAGQAGQNYNSMTNGLNQSMGYLGGVMRGQNSVAAEQLRQGMQQGLAAQQAMAAGAAPQNQAMAARQAAMNMGRLGYGLSGQQALAGIQERNAAANSLGNMQLQARGQDLNGALGAYNNILNGQQDKGYLDRNAQAIGSIGAAIAAA